MARAYSFSTRTPKGLRAQLLARLVSDIDLRIFSKTTSGQVATCQRGAGASAFNLGASLLFSFSNAALVTAKPRFAGVDIGLVDLTRTDLVVEIFAGTSTTACQQSNDQKGNASSECQISHIHSVKTSTTLLAIAWCYREPDALDLIKLSCEAQARR